jgi:monoterpene epsilon-lactone hydrolase
MSTPADEQHTRVDSLVADLARGQRTADIRQIRLAMAAHMQRLSFPLAAEEHVAVTLGGVQSLRMAPSRPMLPPLAMLYLHGGGFVCGTASLYASFADYLCQLAGATAYVPDYRLAPESPYPAAVDDAVAVWRELLEEFASPRLPARIAVVADSAGAAIALRAFEVVRQSSPSPACAIVLMSPLVDLTATAPSLSANSARDSLVTRAAVKAMARMYAPGRDPADPAVSPALSTLDGYPPMLVQASTSEALRDDAASLVARARDQGVDAVLALTPGMPHVFQVFAGFLAEARAAAEQAGRFVRTAASGFRAPEMA